MKFKGVDLSLLNDDEVIFFIRIRGKKSYFNMVYTHAFLSLFKNVSEYLCISEYKKDADFFIDLNTIERDYLTENEYRAFADLMSLEDVIRRCRGLREIPFEQAKKLVYRAYLFFTRFYEQQSELKVVVTGAVDNYVMDIMERVGSSRGVAFLGVTDSFMSPEYKLITVRGEGSSFNEPSDKDVEQTFLKIKNTELSPIVPKKKKALHSACYDLGSYLYRYTFRYLLKHKLLGRLEYEYQFAPLLRKFSSIQQLRALKKLKSKESLRLDPNTRYAYVPLHYYPEATTDYWMHDVFHVDYLNSIQDTILKLKKEGFVVLVKEHPSFYLARFPSFYEAVEKVGGILVTPFMSTREIFELADLIVVWNGSTGIEAIVHGKPIVKVTNSYYGDGIVPSLHRAAELPVVSDEKGKQVVRKVLESSFRTI